MRILSPLPPLSLSPSLSCACTLTVVLSPSSPWTCCLTTGAQGTIPGIPSGSAEACVLAGEVAGSQPCPVCWKRMRVLQLCWPHSISALEIRPGSLVRPHWAVLFPRCPVAPSRVPWARSPACLCRVAVCPQRLCSVCAELLLSPGLVQLPGGTWGRGRLSSTPRPQPALWM